MQLSEVFSSLGEESFQQLLRTISMGKLRTYQLFDRIKARAHLHKLNSEHLRHAAPRLWARIQDNDQEFATDLAQAILVSNLDMIRDILNFLAIPNEDGFFAKDIDGSKYLTEGWQQRTWHNFRNTYSPAVLLFYINHLAWELAKDTPLFLTPSAPAPDSGPATPASP